jgi:hypothetical protein
LRGEQNGIDVEEIIRGADFPEERLKQRNGDALQLDVFDFGPVGRKGFEPKLSGVLKLFTIAGWKFLIT